MLESRSTSVAITASDLPSATPPADGIKFERLLSDISAKLIAVDTERLGQTIESALESVRRFFRADRCGLLAVSDNLETLHVTQALNQREPVAFRLKSTSQSCTLGPADGRSSNDKQ